jgi:hypothetical protein
MIASFAQANGVDLRQENNGALKRLGDRVLAGVKNSGTNSSPRRRKAGHDGPENRHEIRLARTVLLAL